MALGIVDIGNGYEIVYLSLEIGRLDIGYCIAWILGYDIGYR